MAIRTGRSTPRQTLADNRWMMVSSTTYLFAGFYDDTRIFANGVLVDTLNKQQIKSISLSANDIISSNRPISFSRSGSGQTGIPYAWQGNLFAHRSDRYNVAFYIVATENDATIEIEDSRNLGTNYFSGTVSTTAYTTVTVGDTDSQFIIRSLDNPIAVLAGELSTSDVLPLYPCATELFGTASSDGHMIATEDNTTITEFSTSGSTTTRTLNKGDQSGFTYDAGSQFTGQSVRLVADKLIAAESQADADGGEMTPFAAKDAFGKQFVIPENEREFVVLVSDAPAIATAYDQSGNVLSTTALIGSSANGVYNARLTGTSSYEAVLIETDQPVYAIYEGEADDETVLFGHYPTESAVHYSPRTLTDSLVLSLDAANPKSYPGSGTTWFDLSKNGYNAINSGPTFTDSNGIRYFNFDGSNDKFYLESLFYTTPNELSEMSVFAWVRTTYNSGTPGVWNNNNWAILDFDRSEVFTFTLNGTGEIQMSGSPTSGGFGSNFDIVGNQRFNDGEWHYVGWTFSVTNQEIVMYGDGEIDRTFTADGTLIGISDGTTRYGYIGDGSEAGSEDGGGNDIYFSGDISALHFYDLKALTPTEVKQNFNALRGRYGI